MPSLEEISERAKYKSENRSQFWRDLRNSIMPMLGVPLPTKEEQEALRQSIRMGPSVMQGYPSRETDLIRSHDDKLMSLSQVGAPIFYHGSPKRGLTAFDMNAPKTTAGSFTQHGVSLSPEKSVAQRYAKDFGKGSVYKVDASIKNPLKLTASEFEKLQKLTGRLDRGEQLSEFHSIDLENILGKAGIKWDLKSHPVDAIKSAGYDAIQSNSGRYGIAEPEVLVFDPKRLKIMGEE